MNLIKTDFGGVVLNVALFFAPFCRSVGVALWVNQVVYRMSVKRICYVFVIGNLSYTNILQVCVSANTQACQSALLLLCTRFPCQG